MKLGKSAWKASIVLSLIGLAISIYLTAYHYAGVKLICSTTGLINCENVLNSPYAYIFGIPIAVYGVIFFGIELLLLRRNNLDFVFVWNGIGIGSVLYFMYLEWRIGSICIWCTGTHIVVLTLLLLSVSQVMKQGK